MVIAADLMITNAAVTATISIQWADNTVGSLLTIVGAATVAQSVGLSAPLGAFLAGMVLGETEYRHQIEADLQPFQAVLLGLFCASVGMLLDSSGSSRSSSDSRARK